jgi:hydrogenase expression/formation protein HypC
MCLAIPSRITEIDGLMAVIDVFGARRKVSLMLMPEEAGAGDYVLVHAGFAIQKVDYNAAQESLKVISTIIEELSQGGAGADDLSEEQKPLQ